MDVRLRIQTIMLIEQMDKHPEHAKELGLENDSVFSGDRNQFFYIYKEEETNEYHYDRYRSGCSV